MPTACVAPMFFVYGCPSLREIKSGRLPQNIRISLGALTSDKRSREAQVFLRLRKIWLEPQRFFVVSDG